jgi:hypothetical protein
MPKAWSTRQVLITNPAAPSLDQINAASRGRVETLSVPRLAHQLLRERPDVVLLACTGPVVEALTSLPMLTRDRRRPVLVTGLPGISLPTTVKAVRHRARCDLFVAHSHGEVAELTRLARAYAPGLQIGLARLLFLVADRPPRSVPARLQGDVVFAAQARLPEARTDREEVLRALAALVPAGTAVVKLRAGAGEQQTHREVWSYPDLWQDLVDRGEVEPGRIRFVTGSMTDALASARGLVTVSSTAALEAVARGVPIVVLSDFGVSAKMINIVFANSGCLGTLADLGSGHFRWPAADWLDRHYFHPATDDDWLTRLEDLACLTSADPSAQRRLPPRPPRRTGSRLAACRRQARVLLPAWTARAVQSLQRTRSPVR